MCNFFQSRIGYPDPCPVPVSKQILDIRIRLQTHYPAGYPTGKPDSDHLCTALLSDSRCIGNPTKSLKHDRECLTELLERALFQLYAIQRIQLAEVGWESDNKGFDWKWNWVVCIKSWTTFSDAKTTTVEQISLFKLIFSKNDGLMYLVVLPVG